MNEPRLVSDPVLTPLISFGTLIFLTVFFILLEWKRQTPYLALRIISVIIMMLALSGFLFRPLYKTTKVEQIVLLTPEYKVSQIDSLLSLCPTLHVLHSPGTKSYKNSMAVKSYHDLSNKQDNIAFILGQGLPPEGLDMFEFPRYQFIPSSYPEGIVRLSLPTPVLSNRKNTIDGVYHNPAKNLKIFLEGQGGKEDSAEFTKNGFQHFELSFFPKEAGNFLYSLYSEDSLYGEFPVSVQQQKSLNILFLQHYPTFETRYLKEFLGKHHQLLFRYQISKNRYRYEFINRKYEALNRLTIKLLSNFDLIIIDSDALQSLGGFELKSLQSAIEEGLGMITLFNSPPYGLLDFIPYKFERYPSDTAHIYPNGIKKSILPAWPFSVQSELPVAAIIKNKNRVLSGYSFKGFGKIGFQLLQETYRLTLQGDSIGYSSLWSGLIEQVSRSDKAEFTIDQKIKFPFFPDVPIPFEIISKGREPVVSVNKITIPLEENILIDDWWSGRFWTDKPGWNKLSVGEDSLAMDFYISNKNEWRSLAIANSIENTQKTSGTSIADKRSKIIYIDIPQWIFYCLFLLSAGLLWLVPKL